MRFPKIFFLRCLDLSNQEKYQFLWFSNSNFAFLSRICAKIRATLLRPVENNQKSASIYDQIAKIGQKGTKQAKIQRLQKVQFQFQSFISKIRKTEYLNRLKLAFTSSIILNYNLGSESIGVYNEKQIRQHTFPRIEDKVDDIDILFADK